MRACGTTARRREASRARLMVAAALCATAACSSTTDSLGYNGANGIVLHPIHGPAEYPNAFRDVLGASDDEIQSKIDAAYDQLFHGDSGLEAIYFTSSSDQAYIRDIYHDDIRTEGIGYAMMISVELNKRDEFDKLWRYAKAQMQVTSGPAAGYFSSVCDPTMTCYDPFGLQQFVMALLLAQDRWGALAPTIDYAGDVKPLLTIMRHKTEETDGGIVDGGIVDGALDTFDSPTALVFDQPKVTDPERTRPSIEMPAYYELWAQATGDPFWKRAATSARSYWRRVAHPKTGLTPVKSDFEGTPVSGFDTFKQEAYRAQINVVIDAIWTGRSSWAVDESNKLLQFFISQGISTYGDQYSLDGKTEIDATHDPALVSANSISAVVATVTQRESFLSQLYSMSTPIGGARYFSGLVYLLALLIGGGQFVVF
jgi:oligosaccharide reducing-end xylanase